MRYLSAALLASGLSVEPKNTPVGPVANAVGVSTTVATVVPPMAPPAHG